MLRWERVPAWICWPPKFPDPSVLTCSNWADWLPAIAGLLARIKSRPLLKNRPPRPGVLRAMSTVLCIKMAVCAIGADASSYKFNSNHLLSLWRVKRFVSTPCRRPSGSGFPPGLTAWPRFGQVSQSLRVCRWLAQSGRLHRFSDPLSLLESAILTAVVA